jgi:hypothetical protein
MASTKKKSAAKKSPANRPSLSSLARLIQPTLWILAVLFVAWGVSAARSSLRAAVQTQQPATLQITPLPDWIAPSGSPAAKIPPADLAGASARKMTQRLETSPWVRSVKVRRVPAGFQAEIVYRRPVLAIAWGDGRYCFADRDAIVLDLETLTARGGSACLTVKGAQTTGFPAAGQPLADPRLTEVGGLAEKLLSLREPLHLETILLTSDARARWTAVDILTRTDGRIHWGEMGKNDEKKLAMLVERTRLGASLPKGETWDLTKSDAISPPPNPATAVARSPSRESGAISP